MRTKGFTVAEALVLAAILAILIAMIVGAVSGDKNKEQKAGHAEESSTGATPSPTSWTARRASSSAS